jgi:hypothetical protein
MEGQAGTARNQAADDDVFLQAAQAVPSALLSPSLSSVAMRSFALFAADFNVGSLDPISNVG